MSNRKPARRGFTLIEILIVVVILGILAAIVIPQFTNASDEAQESQARTQLQSMRSQVQLYRVKNDVLPGGMATPDAVWDALTSATDASGAAQTPYIAADPELGGQYRFAIANNRLIVEGDPDGDGSFADMGW